MKDLNERDWKRFLRAMAEGRIVPIIGSEVFNVGETPLMHYIYRTICEEYDIDYSDDITPDQIVDVLNQDFGNGKGEYCAALRRLVHRLHVEIPSPVRKMLGLNRFPVILTTATFPVLEDYLKHMRSNWNVLSYDKRGRYMDNADLLSSNDSKKSLYYLFGKVSSCGSFVATEEDLLSFLHFWHNEPTRPQNLCSFLSDKHLLVLGCDYPDWLFRFMWASFSNNFSDNQHQGQLYLSNQRAMEDRELQKFLSHIKAYYQSDINSFIEELCRRWEAYAIENEIPETPSHIANDIEEKDFFLSYACEDYPVVSRIADYLQRQGASVWFDKYTLKPGGDFPKEIRQAIVSCKRFIPVLSQNTVVEGSRNYRREWYEAIEESRGRLGQKYIQPVKIDNVDIKDPLIPDEFKEKVHIFDSTQSDLEIFTRDIIRALRRS